MTAIKPAIRWVMRYFFQGLLFIAPLFITAYALYFIFIHVDGFINQHIIRILKFNIPGFGVVSMIVVVALIGFLARTIFLKPMLNHLDRTINKTPLVKIIYTSIRDLLSAFVGNKRKFTEPVLVKVSKDCELEKLGFVTQRDLSSLGIYDGRVAVYLPHSYNFSGNLFIVQASCVRPLNAPATEVMKFIVSAGVIDIESENLK